MFDIETFFNTSSYTDFQIELDADPKLLEAIKTNKNLLVRFNATDFHQKFLYLLEKDVNPFELYLTIRTFDIKNYLDILINFYNDKNNLSALCQIINNLKGSDTMTFWCVLQNLKYINMVYSNRHELNLLTGCCLDFFEKNKKKYKFNGMNKFM